MKLEVGKSYLTRGGEKTNPLEHAPDTAPAYPFKASVKGRDDYQFHWNPAGSFLAADDNNSFDLVKEYVELEIGKRYRLRNGDTTHEMRQGEFGLFVSTMGDYHLSWYSNGTFLARNVEHPYDVVAEMNSMQVTKEAIREYLRSPNKSLIVEFFKWEQTPQGADHWDDLYCGMKEMSDDDYKYIVGLL